MLLVAMSLFQGSAARGQALPQPPDLIAKPPYLALVRAMREDELLLTTQRRRIERENHRYRAECLANLRPALVTATIAWAMEPAISAQEVAEATRFFESDAGRKLVSRRNTQLTDGLASTDHPSLPQLNADELAEANQFTKSEAGDKLLVKNITQQPRVLMSVKAELLDLLNTCTETLDGTRQIRYCESASVTSADQACSAQYEVTGPAGDSARFTRVSLYCKFAGSDLTALLTELPGRQETIGLDWRENRTLEVLLPPSIAPRYTQSGYRERGLKYEYRTRKADDPPAAPCVPTAPVDPFGWPVG
jgi:hypothetical protein